MAADVVGYSAMVAKDEPATLARVRTLRTDIIEPLAVAHGGRLFKTTGAGFSPLLPRLRPAASKRPLQALYLIRWSICATV
jgi:adenylate cyclase